MPKWRGPSAASTSPTDGARGACRLLDARSVDNRDHSIAHRNRRTARLDDRLRSIRTPRNWTIRASSPTPWTAPRPTPDSALFRGRSNADCSEVVIVPRWARRIPSCNVIRVAKVGTIRRRQGQKVPDGPPSRGRREVTRSTGRPGRTRRNNPVSERGCRLHAGFRASRVVGRSRRRAPRPRRRRLRIVPTYAWPMAIQDRLIQVQVGTILRSEQSAIRALPPSTEGHAESRGRRALTTSAIAVRHDRQRGQERRAGRTPASTSPTVGDP